MIRKLHTLLLTLSLFSGAMAGQEKVAFSGYLSNMTTVYHIPDYWLWENSLHNRLNLDLYPTDWLTGSVQLRNRFIAGNTIPNSLDMPNRLGGDQGWMDLSWAHDGALGDSAGYVLTRSSGSIVDAVFLWQPGD